MGNSRTSSYTSQLVNSSAEYQRLQAHDSIMTRVFFRNPAALLALWGSGNENNSSVLFGSCQAGAKHTEGRFGSRFLKRMSSVRFEKHRIDVNREIFIQYRYIKYF